MRFILLLSIFVVTLNHVYSNAIDTIEPCSGDENLSIVDLNVDCKLMIFERLHMIELMSLAESNKNLLSIVGEVVRRRFAKKTVIFRCPYETKELQVSRFYLLETEENIDIRHFPTILKVLRYFGHLITKLWIQHFYSVPQAQMAEVYQLVNFYCSDTLKKIHLTNKRGDVFDEFQKPFTAVEHVTLNGKFVKLSNSNMNFTGIFPALKNFTLGYVTIEDPRWFDEIHHLIQLTAEPSNEHSDPVQFLEQIIENNHDITSLHLLFANPQLLKFVSDKLPHLEHLELEYYTEDSNYMGAIHFEQLKSLKVMKSVNSLPNNITFEHIESYETDIRSNACNRWIRFVEDYDTLKVLRVQHRLGDNTILQLTKIKSKLTEVYFDLQREINHENVIEFIENQQELQKVQFYCFWRNRVHSLAVALEERFKDEWKVRETIHNVHMIRRFH